MGVLAYIDRQLHPENIDDRALDARLASLDTLRLSTSEIARDYYLPAQMERRQQKNAQGQDAAAAPDASAPRPDRMSEAMQKQRQVVASRLLSPEPEVLLICRE